MRRLICYEYLFITCENEYLFIIIISCRRDCRSCALKSHEDILPSVLSVRSGFLHHKAEVIHNGVMSWILRKTALNFLIFPKNIALNFL